MRMRDNPLAIYTISSALVIVIVLMSLLVWGDFISRRTSIIRHIHAGWMFPLVLLMGAAVVLMLSVAMAFEAYRLRANRSVALVGSLPMTALVIAVGLLVRHILTH